jgi:putative endonuclease
MGACVYVLESRSGRFYYGSTTDLSRRLEEHSRGYTYTTSRDAPWTLVASREVNSLSEARALERQFKKWKSPQRVLAWFGR